MAEETKARKPRQPRRELDAAQVETVAKRVSEGAKYSTIAKEIDEAAFGTAGWQSLYDAVRRTAIEKFGSPENAIQVKKDAREATKAAA